MKNVPFTTNDKSFQTEKKHYFLELKTNLYIRVGLFESRLVLNHV